MTEPGTEELFLSDAYLREFEARIVRRAGRELTLDRTAFYPGGGGQPPDKGRVGAGPVGAQVIEARRSGSGITHVTDLPLPETVEYVSCELDWDRRYANMRLHTALHALSGLLRTEFGAEVTGGRVRPGRARVDFSLPEGLRLEAGLAEETMRRANEVLAEERPVRVYELSPGEALARPELDRPGRVGLFPERGRTVRVVEIVGVDLRADEGTHVANTREVGEIGLTERKSRGGTRERMEFVLR